MNPPATRTPDEWRQFVAERLGEWWQRWQPSLHRHDDLYATVAAGDNLALLAKQTGLGRQRWIADALVKADMWDRDILVLCPPAVQRHWHQELRQAGIAAERITTLSAWQLNSPKTRARSPYYVAAKLHAADVLIIEPPCRPGTKLFAALAKAVREAGHQKQIITTTTLVWGSATQPPRYVDSCLKLLGYLDDPVKVAWADDCWKGRS